jgi:hypothetical protein
MTITMVQKERVEGSTYWVASGMGPKRRIVVEGLTRGAARVGWHEVARQQRDELSIEEEKENDRGIGDGSHEASSQGELEV